MSAPKRHNSNYIQVTYQVPEQMEESLITESQSQAKPSDFHRGDCCLFPADGQRLSKLSHFSVSLKFVFPAVPWCFALWCLISRQRVAADNASCSASGGLSPQTPCCFNTVSLPCRALSVFVLIEYLSLQIKNLNPPRWQLRPLKVLSCECWPISSGWVALFIWNMQCTFKTGPVYSLTTTSPGT